VIFTISKPTLEQCRNNGFLRKIRDLSKINLLNALAITKDTLDFTMTEENLASSNFNDANFIQNLLEKIRLIKQPWQKSKHSKKV
jgi:hypothetical protein